MEERLINFKNILKNSGISIPPVVIIFMWVFSTYLLYPHQPVKVPQHTKLVVKQKTKKIPTIAISQKDKTTDDTFSYSLQTPTPTITVVSTTQQPTIETTSKSIVTPTLTPVPPAVSTAGNSVKQPDFQQEITPTTLPVDNQNIKSDANQNQNNNSFAGMSKDVIQIVPTAVSLLNANPLLSK